jgi:hypothetical protein
MRLNLNDIKRIQKQITNAHKSKFSHTLTMAKLVVKAENGSHLKKAKFECRMKVCLGAKKNSVSGIRMAKVLFLQGA